MNMLYNIIIPEPSIFFYMMDNCVTITVTCNEYVTVCNSHM